MDAIVNLVMGAGGLLLSVSELLYYCPCFVSTLWLILCGKCPLVNTLHGEPGNASGVRALACLYSQNFCRKIGDRGGDSPEALRPGSLVFAMQNQQQRHVASNTVKGEDQYPRLSSEIRMPIFMHTNVSLHTYVHIHQVTYIKCAQSIKIQQMCCVLQRFCFPYSYTHGYGILRWSSYVLIK